MPAQTRVTDRLMDDLKKEIKRAVKVHGMSMTEIADRAEIGRAYLHRIRDGKQTPSLMIAAKIADAIGMKLTLEKTA